MSMFKFTRCLIFLGVFIQSGIFLAVPTAPAKTKNSSTKAYKAAGNKLTKAKINIQSAAPALQTSELAELKGAFEALQKKLTDLRARNILQSKEIGSLKKANLKSQESQGLSQFIRSGLLALITLAGVFATSKYFYLKSRNMTNSIYKKVNSASHEHSELLESFSQTMLQMAQAMNATNRQPDKSDHMVQDLHSDETKIVSQLPDHTF